MTPDNPEFENLPHREQVRIYRAHGWTTRALSQEFDITVAKVRRWLMTPEKIARHKEQMQVYRRSEKGRASNRASCRRHYARKTGRLAAWATGNNDF